MSVFDGYGNRYKARSQARGTALGTLFKILPHGPIERAYERDLAPDDVPALQLEASFNANEMLTRVLDDLSPTTALYEGAFVLCPSTGDDVADRWQVEAISRPILLQDVAVRRFALLVYRPKKA